MCALHEYVGKFTAPETIHLICEENLAAAKLDREHDEADRVGGRRIACPTLALWSSAGAVSRWRPLEVWKT